MFNQELLTLRTVRLQPAQEWLSEPQQLTFVFQKKGTGSHVNGKVSQRLAPGDVSVVNAAQGSKVCVQNGGEAMFCSFSLTRDNLLPLCGNNEICLLQHVVDDLKMPKFYPASSQLALECNRLLSSVPTECDLGHRSQLLRVASVILSAEFKNAQRRHIGPMGLEQHLIQVFESLSSAEICNLSVDELAAKFNCSRRHLNRLFHQYFGFSVATLKMELRLLKSIALLRDPDAKVIHVAEECGFNHLGIFNKCFKRRFGDSPGHWRKDAAQIQNPVTVRIGNDLEIPFRPKDRLPASVKQAEYQPVHRKPLPKQNGSLGRVLTLANGVKQNGGKVRFLRAEEYWEDATAPVKVQLGA